MDKYSEGLSAGTRIVDESYKKIMPYWVYGAVDCSRVGLDPLYDFCAAFADREDAEAFIEYRKEHIKKHKTLFKIEDYTKGCDSPETLEK